MEHRKVHGTDLGEKIYFLRTARRMTQEQLGEELCISPAAVSKWERNLARPDIEMLWALADLFGCTIDELAGRKTLPLERLGVYDDNKLRLLAVAADLQNCSEISREKGLLALESAVSSLESGSRFLSFAVSCALELFMMKTDAGLTFGIVENYVKTLPEEEQQEGRMIAGALRLIFSGERPEIIREYTASCIGMDHREKRSGTYMGWKGSRAELLDRFRDKKMYSAATDLLEGFCSRSDFEIQVILRNLDNAVLTAALSGASGDAAVRFLSNLADRVLYYISEDLEQWKGTEEEILLAQKKVLEAGSFQLEHV